MPPNTEYFYTVFLSAQLAHETEVHSPIETRVDAVEEPNFIACFRQEEPHHLHNLFTSKDEPRIAPRRIVLSQFLAQEREEQANLETEWATGNEAGDLLFRLPRIPLPQIGVAFGFVDDQLQAKESDMIPYTRLKAHERLPDLLLFIAIENAFEQRNKYGR